MNKFFVKENNTAVIYADNYSKSIEKLAGLAEELQRDYPSLKSSDIEVGIFGGDKRQGIPYVIAKADYPPTEDYFEVNDWYFFI